MKFISAQITEEFKARHTGALIGFMALSCKENQKDSPALQSRKDKIVQTLQARFSDQEILKNDSVIQAYQRYYQQYKSNYHVRFQIESVALKGKGLPTRSVLVDAMFMAELEHGVLIAGHDVDFIQLPLSVDCTHEGEFYTLLSGDLKSVKSGDMCIRDAEKILSTILYGPDESSPISLKTTQALYCIYGPNGVLEQKISDALDAIAEHIQTTLLDVEVLWKSIVSA